MENQKIWELLGIPQTEDKKAIRRAYAAQARLHHPEEEPELFAALNAAYQEALTGAGRKNVSDAGQTKARTLHDVSFAQEQTVQEFLVQENQVSEKEELTKENQASGKEEPREQEKQLSEEKPTSLLTRLEKAEQQKIEESMQKGALRAFIALFENPGQGKRKKQALVWREYFLSEDFLREQFSDEFGRGMLAYLKGQSVCPADNLPAGFLLELALAYAFVPYYAGTEYLPDREYPKEWYKVDVNESFPARKYAGEIWNMQGLECDLKSVTRQMDRPDNRVRHHAFADYLTLKTMNRNGRLTEKDKEDWTRILDAGYVSRLYERNGKSVGAELYEARSECVIKLYAQWLRDEQVPSCVLQYMYKKYQFKELSHSSSRGLYGPLKEEVLKQLPKAEQELYDTEGKEQKITRFYKAFAGIINENHTNYEHGIYGDTEEIKTQVQTLFAMPEWSELKNDLALFDKMYRNLLRKVMPESMAHILIAHYSAPEWQDPKRGTVVVESLVCSLSTNPMMRERDWRQTISYEKTDVRDISEEHADFWQYFFSCGYGFRSFAIEGNSDEEAEYVTDHACVLPIYIRYLYDPSVEWQKRFTGFDEETEEIKSPVSVCVRLVDGRTLRAEFHLHYILYFLDEMPVIAPAFSFEQLLEQEKAMESAVSFFFLLAVTAIGETEREAAKALIEKWLERLPFHPAVCPCLAKLLAADNDRLPGEERVRAVFYEEQERFCFRAVVCEQGVFLYRQVSYGWEDKIFRAKESGWIPVPLLEDETEHVKGLDLEKKKQFAREKLDQLKQPKPVKLAAFSLEGMDGGEKMAQILEAMKQQESFRLKGRKNHLHQTEVSWNPQQLNEKFEKFVEDYGCLLTESYCVFHYGSQKGKRYEKVFYSAMYPYGFQLDAHAGDYVSHVAYEERILRTKIKEKCVLLGRFGWGFKYSPKSDFQPRVVFLGESGTYYAYDGIRTLRDTDFVMLLAKLFKEALEGLTSVDIYKGYLSVSRLDHRLEYCYGEEELWASLHSSQNTVADYFTMFGRQPEWAEFERWLDEALEKGVPEDVGLVHIRLYPGGGTGCFLKLTGIARSGIDNGYEKDCLRDGEEIYTAEIPPFLWKAAARVYDTEKEVCHAVDWYLKFGRYAGVMKREDRRVAVGNTLY